MPVVLYLIFCLIKKENFKNNTRKDYFVSIIVPCFNEEKVIQSALKSIAEQKYNNYEVIVVNDGSTDDTSEKIKNFIETVNSDKFKFISTNHEGKAKAMNKALKIAKGEVIATVDADTVLEKDALDNILYYFKDDIGSVSGNIKVKKEHNSILSRLQELEYSLSQEVFRFSQSRTGNCLIVPGCFCVYNRKYLKNFEEGTLAEDFDTSSKLLKNGFKNVFAKDAIAYTSIPNNWRDVINQRLRWQEGGFQVVSKWLFRFPRKSTIFWYFWFFFSSLQGAFIRMFTIVMIPLYIIYSWKTLLILLVNLVYTILLYTLIIYFHDRKYQSKSFRRYVVAMPLFSLYFFFLWSFSTFAGQLCALKGVEDWLKVKRN